MNDYPHDGSEAMTAEATSANVAASTTSADVTSDGATASSAGVARAPETNTSASGTTPVQDEVLTQLREMMVGGLDERMGMEVLEASPERVVMRMPVAGNTQPMGLLHGGANVVIAESAGSIAATLAAGPGRFAVGLDINATHHRSARSGHVTATATALSVGRTLACYDVAIEDDEGRRTCTARITCMLRDAQ